MSEPAISVIMPVHNAQGFLKHALDSLLSQTFNEFEVIAIDDGSTDRSGTILESYASLDPRIRLVRRENRGVVASLNEGLQLARAPLVARMDADDIALPERFSRQRAFLKANPDILAVGSAIQFIDGGGRRGKVQHYPAGRAAVDEVLQYVSPLAHPAVMMRREAVLEAGGYREAFAHAEDYDLWLRLRERGRLNNLPEVLLLYRHHPGQISKRHALAQMLSAAAARELALARQAGRKEPDWNAHRPIPFSQAGLLVRGQPRLAALVALLDAALASPPARGRLMRERLKWVQGHAAEAFRGPVGRLLHCRLVGAALRSGEKRLALWMAWGGFWRHPIGYTRSMLALKRDKWTGGV